jgi:hypothetical protein
VPEVAQYIGHRTVHVAFIPNRKSIKEKIVNFSKEETKSCRISLAKQFIWSIVSTYSGRVDSKMAPSE